MTHRHQRGAVIVQVAVAMLVLCGFVALGVDYGVLQAARGQAQNAADAGALAGAMVAAFDHNRLAANAEAAATAVASSYPVWDGPPSVTAVANQSTCTPPGLPVPPLVARLVTCVTVEVFRDQAHGNALPTYFAKAIGVDEQGTRARAIATAVPANTTACAWPIAVPDRWSESTVGGWTTSPPSVYEPGDSYTPPSFSSIGDGFELTMGRLNPGIMLTLRQTDTALPIEAGHFVPVQIPGSSFAGALASCSGSSLSIGDTLSVDTGGTITAVTTAASTRRAADAGASWESSVSSQRMRNSCAGLSTPCAAMSPRLVVVPVFNVAQYDATRLTPNPVIRIVNFVGLFIDSVSSGVSVSAHLSVYPGTVDLTKPQVGYTSAFLRSAILYR